METNTEQECLYSRDEAYSTKISKKKPKMVINHTHNHQSAFASISVQGCALATPITSQTHSKDSCLLLAHLMLDRKLQILINSTTILCLWKSPKNQPLLLEIPED